MSAYSKSELYQLWQGFKGQAHETRSLADFANTDTATAKELLREFREQEAARK